MSLPLPWVHRDGAPAARVTRSLLAGSLLVGGLFAGGTALAGPASGEGLRQPVVDSARASHAQARSRWEEAAWTFETMGDRIDPLFVAADAASALAGEAQRAGWNSPAVPGLVDALVATAKPDGGFGLAREWDAFQDGTVNPDTTSYTATTAGHVGAVLLAGYTAGVVPVTVVNRAIDSILDLPRAPGDPCIPYSNSPHDLGRPCVWNTHFGSAAWVKEASGVTGHRRDDVTALISSVTSVLVTLRADPRTGYLPYSSAQTAPQDIGHQLWTANAIDYLRGDRTFLTVMVRKQFWRVQAGRSHDHVVASAMSGIALFDCRYATDPLVLTHASATHGGTPYAFKALATQARTVLGRCFGVPGDQGTSGATSLPADLGLLQPDLG
ncbi:MAG: hypothetical protein QG622_2082 [Actinomycetota bacterium]|nr:hypothetical protein [Actinomycetota bacterium]